MSASKLAWSGILRCASHNKQTKRKRKSFVHSLFSRVFCFLFVHDVRFFPCVYCELCDMMWWFCEDWVETDWIQSPLQWSASNMLQDVVSALDPTLSRFQFFREPVHVFQSILYISTSDCCSKGAGKGKVLFSCIDDYLITLSSFIALNFIIVNVWDSWIWTFLTITQPSWFKLVSIDSF